VEIDDTESRSDPFPIVFRDGWVPKTNARHEIQTPAQTTAGSETARAWTRPWRMSSRGVKAMMKSNVRGDEEDRQHEPDGGRTAIACLIVMDSTTFRDVFGPGRRVPPDCRRLSFHLIKARWRRALSRKNAGRNASW